MCRRDRAYAARAAAIEGGMEHAEEAQAAADAAKAQYEAQLKEARTEATQIREDARVQGSQIVAEMRGQAQAEATGQWDASPVDLFQPDLSLRPAKRAVPVAPLSAEKLQTLLKAERARFQKGLLAWLTHSAEPHVALENMRAALDNIEW